MQYSTRQLITRSYWLSQTVSRGLQTLTGEQMEEGLFLLNEFLGDKSSDLRAIPYWKRHELILVQGQERYYIEGLLDIETLTFNLEGNVVRFKINPQTRKEYFGTSRVNNIQSLPFSFRLERELKGSSLWVYFLPNQGFTAELTGKFALTDVTLDDDLSLVYDVYYLKYLRYSVAKLICNEYAVPFNPDSAQELAVLEKKLMDLSPPDLSVSKINFSGGNNAINWATINLSNGYLPPGA